VSLPAASPDPERLSIFAARRRLDSALTLIVINKSSEAIEAQISFSDRGNWTGQVYQYSDANLKEIQTLPDISLTSGEVKHKFPPQAITLMVLTQD
ncbi:MAG: hypothetical protein ACK2UW_09810, partial [Anaerolineales bacterium]